MYDGKDEPRDTQPLVRILSSWLTRVMYLGSLIVVHTKLKWWSISNCHWNTTLTRVPLQSNSTQFQGLCPTLCFPLLLPARFVLSDLSVRYIVWTSEGPNNVTNWYSFTCKGVFYEKLEGRSGEENVENSIDSGIGLSITIDKLRVFINKTLSILRPYQ